MHKMKTRIMVSEGLRQQERRSEPSGVCSVCMLQPCIGSHQVWHTDREKGKKVGGGVEFPNRGVIERGGGTAKSHYPECGAQ